MPPQQQQHFTFVNVSTPHDTKNAGNKKRIRSAAAASGWAQGSRPRPGQALEAPSQSARFPTQESAPTGQTNPENADSYFNLELKEKEVLGREDVIVTSDHPAREFVRGTSRERKRVSADSGATDDPDLHPNRSNIKKKRTQRDKRPSASNDRTQPALALTTSSSRSSDVSSRAAVSSWLSSVTSPGTVTTTPESTWSNPYDLGGGCGDAFNCYPVDSQPWFDRVLHHMLTVFAPRGWPALGISNAEGLNWERFMTQHALADAALFNVRLLFASGDLIRMKVLRPETALWLRDQAVRSINEALNDPVRATSDPLILAVGRIALHESMYGDRSAANLIHRPAQHRMIMMRGGMRALEFPELVKRLMRWADRVMSMQSDTPRFLPDDDQSFSIGQSVDVLEKWVPQEGLSLRHKVSTESGRRAP